MPRKKGKINYWLVGVVSGLIIWGILMLASISPAFSQQRFGNSFYFLIHHLGLGMIPGILLGFLAFRIPLSFFKRWGLILLSINLVVLSMVFLPGIGSGFGGAARWINLGPITIQPTEFLKLTFILYLAAWLASKTKQKKQILQKQEKQFSQTFFAFLTAIAIISLLLVLQPDISTLAIIICIAALTYFSADTPLWHTFSLTGLAGLGFWLLIKIAPYRMERLLVFLKPETDPMGIGYQIQQALIGIGSGGILGLGLGMGQQKFGFLPFPMSDSVFVILAEETGFAGSLVLIALFLVFAWQGFKIAKHAQDKFSCLTALGITSWIAVQAFVNIGAMIGILPLTGIPLPFISYGGSALIAELIGVGILLNIAKNS